jgi:hypothetical protein
MNKTNLVSYETSIVPIVTIYEDNYVIIWSVANPRERRAQLGDPLTPLACKWNSARITCHCQVTGTRAIRPNLRLPHNAAKEGKVQVLPLI